MYFLNHWIIWLWLHLCTGYDILYILMISFYTFSVPSFCILYAWWWSHDWPKHLSVHCTVWTNFRIHICICWYYYYIYIYIYSINERIMVHTKFITASLFQFPFRHILFAGGASASIYGKMTKVSSKSHIHHHLSTRTCLNSVQSPKMELTSVKVSI